MSERAPRSSLFLSVEIVADGEFAAVLRNLSVSGALISTDAPLQVGDRAMMRRNGHLHGFRVVRLVYGYLGIAFDIPIDVEAFRRVVSVSALSRPVERFRRSALNEVRPLSQAERRHATAWTSASRHGRHGE